MAFALLAAGLLLLYFGAEWLVQGAARLATSFGIPQLIVGLTVVGYGTSTPELVVGIGSALTGQGAIALGNAIGSNIANLGLILGMTALILPCRVEPVIIRREVPVLILSTALVPLSLLDGRIVPWEAGGLIGLAFLYTFGMILSARKPQSKLATARIARPEAAAAIAGAARTAVGLPRTKEPRLRIAMVSLGGLALLLVGGKVFVEGAIELARTFHIDERVIGLTIVAVGTSLPELATSLIAAIRGHSDIAVGNVIGSNIFNALLILGASSVTGAVQVSLSTIALDLFFLCGMTALGIGILFTGHRVARLEGAALLLAYVSFLIALILA